MVKVELGLWPQSLLGIVVKMIVVMVIEVVVVEVVAVVIRTCRSL